MIEISKELLLELKLFNNIENREWKYEVNGNTLKVVYNITNCFNGNWFTINIYELMNKMKLWAYNNDYEIMSGTMLDDNLMLAWYATVYPVTATINSYSLRFDNEANNEFETVKECCEWILKEIKKC